MEINLGDGTFQVIDSRKVEGCSDCPYLTHDGPGFEPDKYTCEMEGYREVEYIHSIPSWCPVMALAPNSAQMPGVEKMINILEIWRLKNV